MNTEPTLPQDGAERRHAQQRSLSCNRPPTETPGYDPERLLGVGAFGEVWVAKERNTGRPVAIKFYTHQGGLDWSLLSREVEKLSFLFADRHVVQLIGVGWDAEPPYYIMEYLDQGSLADRLQVGALSVSESVDLFHEVAVGLIHAHGKGVLHCDLKPGNILLDQDGRPRLADFGQSRFSHEQAPTLGTLFYMAPEQANLTAAPDARWDVYALGALLYCMLTGGPPHRNQEDIERIEQVAELKDRLALYRRMIRKGPPPAAHRQVPGVDRELGDIVDRCLAIAPEKRYPNVQAVMDALDGRETRRARRPTMILGTVGPAMVLLVASLFAWLGFRHALVESEDALIASALERNSFAAESTVWGVANGVGRRNSVVGQLPESDALREVFLQTARDPSVRDLLEQLAGTDLNPRQRERLVDELQKNPQRQKLRDALEEWIPTDWKPGVSEEANSWFLFDHTGIQIARFPESSDKPGFRSTVGGYYGWRSYFRDGPGIDITDNPNWRHAPEEHIRQTQLSAAYQSKATHRWNVAVTTPIFDRNDRDKFLGLGGMSVGVEELVEFPGTEEFFAVLIQRPDNGSPGHVLDHPLFAEAADGESLPEDFSQLRMEAGDLPNSGNEHDYTDLLAEKSERYQGRWLAKMVPVRIEDESTGWSVIVEQSYDRAIGENMARLTDGLVQVGLAAAVMVAVVVLGLWGVAFRLLNQTTSSRSLASMTSGGTTPDLLDTPTSPTLPAPVPRSHGEDVEDS